MEFVWITDLCPEELDHVDEQIEVANGGIFLVHEELGRVGLSGDDIHPGLEGRGYGKVGFGGCTVVGLQFALIDDEVAAAFDRAGECELQGGLRIGGGLGVEADLHDSQVGGDRVRSGHHAFGLEFLGGDAFGDAGLPHQVAQEAKSGGIADGLGDTLHGGRRDGRGIDQFLACQGGGFEYVRDRTFEGRVR